MPTIKLPTPIATAGDLLLGRRAANLTQEQLADMCCLSRRQLSHLEKGHSAITPSTGMLLAAILHLVTRNETAIPAVEPGTRMVPVHAKPLGRPSTFKSNERVFEHALPDGAPLTWSQVKDLPIGAAYLKRYVGDAKWRPMTRNEPNALYDTQPGMAVAPVPTQERPLTDSEHAELQAIMQPAPQPFDPMDENTWSTDEYMTYMRGGPRPTRDM